MATGILGKLIKKDEVSGITSASGAIAHPSGRIILNARTDPDQISICLLRSDGYFKVVSATSLTPIAETQTHITYYYIDA